MRHFLLLLPLFLATSARACLNDRDSDSLATQAAKFPDTLHVITGRFERNPPLFYQMRIQREAAQLQKSPRDFGLYDDSAVAFDKLHRDDQALQIMAKKRAMLPPFDAKNPAMKEAWYRYFANTGTFNAHHYLGEKAGDLSEMKTARGMIKRAIEIKPNAHFGREKVQLLLMDWILATKTGETNLSLSNWVPSPTVDDSSEKVEGWSGMIVLGAAWENVDVFDELAVSLQGKEGVLLSYLAFMRRQELFKQGHKSLMAGDIDEAVSVGGMEFQRERIIGMGLSEKNQKTLRELFHRLRAEAERWNTQRQGYMLARLQKGDHPDTNPKFWADWKPKTPPIVELDWMDEEKQRFRGVMRRADLLIWFLSTAGLGAFGLLLWSLFKARYVSK